MNDLLRSRLLRKLEAMGDERAYQVLDFIEFLESKYAERSVPAGFFARITETVETTMRAGKIPVRAISGTMTVMDTAGKMMRGLVAAGHAVVEEAAKAVGGEKPEVRGPEPGAVSPPSGVTEPNAGAGPSGP